MTAKVHAERVSKVYVTRQGPMIAVHDLSLEMRHEHFVCLLGPSGCGKSTLLSMIAGFVTPKSDSKLKPHAGHVAAYKKLIETYAERERAGIS